jgi:SAM-dependent methyltransferase
MKKILKNQLTRIATILPTSQAWRRKRLARAYLSGNGLEIGALHNPLKLPPHAHVTYLNRMTESQLRQQYPELSDIPHVPVQIVDNGETLASIRAESMDFVFANHMIENSENPLLALQNWIRVLRKNGVLYLAIPNKKKTFDRDRAVTSTNHIFRDYETGPAASRQQHF